MKMSSNIITYREMNINYKEKVLLYMVRKVKEFDIYDSKTMEDEYYTDINHKMYTEKERIALELSQLRKQIIYSDNSKSNVKTYNNLYRDYSKMDNDQIDSIKTRITALQVELGITPRFYTVYCNYFVNPKCNATTYSDERRTEDIIQKKSGK